MKKIVLFWLLAGLLPAAQAQSKKESRQVDDFTKITFRAPGTVYLVQGAVTKLELEGDADFLDQLETVVRDGRLTIGLRDGWRNWRWNDNDRVTARITTPSVEALSVSGAGSIKAQGRWNTNRLKVNVSGSGSIEIAADASEHLQAEVSGSGWLALSGSSKTLQAEVSGSGRVTLRMNVYETASLDISGSGRIEASGSAGIAKLDVSGSGKILADEFQSNKGDVRISGSGDLALHVKDELEARITGSGTVNYRGNPAVVHTHTAGSGRVRKIE